MNYRVKYFTGPFFFKEIVPPHIFNYVLLRFLIVLDTFDEEMSNRFNQHTSLVIVVYLQNI